ncbi:MAG: hypothetical protein R3Y11_10530, partial [Pseudomonadota bacterium]
MTITTPFPSSAFFFDKQDKTLLHLANKVLDKQSLNASQSYGAPSHMVRKLFDANLHPHGIKELAVTHELRVAYAVMNLLDSLEAGRTEDRLLALTALRDEVLSSAQTTLQRNTARVLIQIMKELVRAHGDPCRQIKLAHDFRDTAAGKPRIVRAMLDRYNLLEMPEEWNQVAFDNHVHDASTKGRKNPTHLIMDAWVKGIRHLTVIYYNYIDGCAAQELLQAAQIMGVAVRIGVEFRSPFHGRYVDFIWVPRGFSHGQELLDFLDEPPVQALFAEGRKASNWQERYVFATLARWNTIHRLAVNEEFGLTLEPITKERFTRFVGSGQASLLHLAECVHQTICPAFASRVAELRDELECITSSIPAHEQHDNHRIAHIHETVKRMNSVDAEAILENWLDHAVNADLPNPDLVPEAPILYPREKTGKFFASQRQSGHRGQQLDAELNDQRYVDGLTPPELLQMPPHILLDWLTSLHSDYRVTLNLGGVNTADTLELLWQCGGLITHLEIFNLKDWSQGRAEHMAEISELQGAINQANMPLLKRIIQTILQEYEGNAERAKTFRTILHGMVELQNLYTVVPLRSRLGTDSTSRSHRQHGMGLVFPETLPPRAQRALKAKVVEAPSATVRLLGHNARATDEHARPLCEEGFPIEDGHHASDITSQNTNQNYQTIGQTTGQTTGHTTGQSPITPNNKAARQRLPIHSTVYRRESHIPQRHPLLGRGLSEWLRRLPLCSRVGTKTIVDWKVSTHSTRVTASKNGGNIATLGKSLGMSPAHLSLDDKEDNCSKARLGIAYLNNTLLNCIKILIGFIPAMMTFHYTQTWWLLAWFGALIWFSITGVRNIVQAVLAGGGGWRSTPLLRWNNYVSWSRMSDSLMFTGLSVPILELGMRTLLLQDTLGMDSQSHPAIVFTVIATANGLYIASHNIYRGLQTEAIIGNMFRSVLAIPVAMSYTTILFEILSFFNVYDPWVMLQPSATIISKMASDTVAAIVEGFADRCSNLRMRSWDYQVKLTQFFANYARLEVLLPEEDIMELLRSPKILMRTLNADARHLESAIIISALDLMYFWMYQPRARHIFHERLNAMSKEEQSVLLLSQFVLTRERAVSQLFVDGLVGSNFSRPLAFYLDQREQYLRDMSR